MAICCEAGQEARFKAPNPISRGAKNRQHVFIKLEAEKNDEHTEEIGEGKARKLRYADMLTQ